MEVTIHTLRNGVVRVEDAEESLYAAIDLVCDKVRMPCSEGAMHQSCQTEPVGWHGPALQQGQGAAGCLSSDGREPEVPQRSVLR